MSDTVTDEAADEGVWEYVTYAPEGARCSECKRVVDTLEPVRRGVEDRVSGPPVVIYRHAKDKQCPGPVEVAA